MATAIVNKMSALPFRCGEDGFLLLLQPSLRFNQRPRVEKKVIAFRASG